MAVAMLVLSGCDACDLAKGDLHDAQRAYNLKKKFMESFVFKGTVLKQTRCDECDDRSKYQVLIALEKTEPQEVEFSNRMYPPNYSIDVVKKQMTIGVAKDVYDAATRGAQIEKHKDSDFITVSGREYRLIGYKQYQWLP